jgi:hypothetical protein
LPTPSNVPAGDPLTATCACGSVSITVSGAPRLHVVCHCSNCKRRTGSAFGVSAYFDRTAVMAVVGEMKVYAFRHDAQRHDQERHFCQRCGTTLFWFISTWPDKIGIAAGCFGEQPLPEPRVSVADAQRKAWVTLPSSWKVDPG